MNKPNSISIQQAVQKAEKEIKRIADAESDPMLRAILLGRIDLSISDIADSIEKKYLEGSIVKQSDGEIDPGLSTMTFDILQYVRSSLEETKKWYLSQHDNEKSPADILVENAHYVIAYYSIRKEWDLWAAKQQLLASEAIPLMNGLDPLSWQEYERNEKSFPNTMTQSIYRSLEMAEKEKISILTPFEWLNWGRKHDLDQLIIKSRDWLQEPDTCMFYLFEDAVNKITIQNVQSETKEEFFSRSKNEENKEHELHNLIKETYIELGCPKSNSAVWKALKHDVSLHGIENQNKKYDKEGIIQEMNRMTIYWESKRSNEQEMSHKTFCNYLAKLRNQKKHPG